ncbi:MULTISPECIES: SapC family protein [unclassified Massilia]|uniref:SapC family protein n=1 Tax=unclassified Massilia TaxID=2609279 RepID=UPI00177DCCB6|nr:MULTISPECIES: SapC family protein [unclassified Massilia]MBD8530824.1 SapC family protein [Massilia sp. CFBP 13647]MBD8674523.1 SapC family protein [Massilia sp. CFBP 13721]
MTTLLFYKNVVALDRELHKSLKIKPAQHLKFAADATALPIVMGEFVEVARQFPIGFLRVEGGGILPVALVGLPDGKNLFLTEDGKWDAPYVPAFVRRYPFVFAETGDDQLTLCIDRDYDGFDENEGTPLFGADGEPDAGVTGVIELLSEFQRQHTATQQFVQRLEQAGVLMEANANATLNDGRNLSLQGLLVVDEQKFRALPEATVNEWFRAGDIGLVYSHLLSLGNLLELVRRQPAAAE